MPDDTHKAFDLGIVCAIIYNFAQALEEQRRHHFHIEQNDQFVDIGHHQQRVQRLIDFLRILFGVASDRTGQGYALRSIQQGLVQRLFKTWRHHHRLMGNIGRRAGYAYAEQAQGQRVQRGGGMGAAIFDEALRLGKRIVQHTRPQSERQTPARVGVGGVFALHGLRQQSGKRCGLQRCVIDRLQRHKIFRRCIGGQHFMAEAQDATRADCQQRGVQRESQQMAYLGAAVGIVLIIGEKYIVAMFAEPGLQRARVLFERRLPDLQQVFALVQLDSQRCV